MYDIIWYTTRSVDPVSPCDEARVRQTGEMCGGPDLGRRIGAQSYLVAVHTRERVISFAWTVITLKEINQRRQSTNGTKRVALEPPPARAALSRSVSCAVCPA